MRYGFAAATTIVLLRLAVGFHFFFEGVDKVQNPKSFTAPFFGAAKGPFAPFYHSHIWDADGRARFDEEQMNAVWSQFVQQAGRHYGFSEEQQTEADELLAYRAEQLKNYFDDIRPDLDEYLQGLERHERNLSEPARTQVPSLRGQTEKWETKLKADRGRWLAAIETLNQGLQQDITDVATPEQRARGLLKVGKPGRRAFDSEAIDRIVPYFDLTLGILLVLGLGVRPAALAGAGFLTMVVSTQWPGTPGAMPVYYQIVEGCALLALAGIGAGRIAGLDVFVQCCFRSCCGRKK